MTHNALKLLMKEANLSYEQLGERLGISGMTLRRWRTRSGNTRLPKLYARAVRDVIYELIIEGSIRPDALSVRTALREDGSLPVHAALSNLGFSPDFLEDRVGHESEDREHDRIISQLGQIGAKAEAQESILGQEQAIRSFKGLGNYWTVRCRTLLEIIKSKALKPLEKLVAVGGLIYLVEPFDSIPDFLPGAGLVDDVGILAMVIAFYATRFPKVCADLLARAEQDTAKPLSTGS